MTQPSLRKEVEWTKNPARPQQKERREGNVYSSMFQKCFGENLSSIVCSLRRVLVNLIAAGDSFVDYK